MIKRSIIPNSSSSVITDFHVHTFPEKIAASALEKLQSKSHTRPFTDGTLNALETSMKNACVSRSVLQPVATKPEQVTGINDKAVKINSDYQNIISFGAMHPYFENYEAELERIFLAGIKGIKLHPVYQGLSVDDGKYIRILQKACALGLAVLIHAGWDIGFPGNDNAMPEKIKNALEKIHSDKKIILAHMGGWRAWNAAKIFLSYEGVYIDTAFSLGEFTPNGDNFYKTREECKMLNEDEFVEIIKTFGAERVIFGSDSPWASQKDSIERLNAIKSLNESDKNLIFSINAEKFFL